MSKDVGLNKQTQIELVSRVGPVAHSFVHSLRRTYNESKNRIIIKYKNAKRCAHIETYFSSIGWLTCSRLVHFIAHIHRRRSSKMYFGGTMWLEVDIVLLHSRLFHSSGHKQIFINVRCLWNTTEPNKTHLIYLHQIIRRCWNTLKIALFLYISIFFSFSFFLSVFLPPDLTLHMVLTLYGCAFRFSIAISFVSWLIY